MRAAPLDGIAGRQPGRRSSTASTRRGRSSTRRTPTGSPASGSRCVSAPDAVHVHRVASTASRSLGADRGRRRAHDRLPDRRPHARRRCHPTPGGGRVQIRSELFVSVARRHVARDPPDRSTPLDRDVTITVDSPIRNRQDERISTPRRSRPPTTRAVAVCSATACSSRSSMQHESLGDPPAGSSPWGTGASASGMSIACTQRHVVDPTTLVGLRHATGSIARARS